MDHLLDEHDVVVVNVLQLLQPRLQVVFLEQEVQHLDGGILVLPVRGRLGLADEGLPGVREWTVAEIVTEAGDGYADDVLVADQIGLLILESLGEGTGQVGRAQAVLEPGVVGTPVQQPRGQLRYKLQPLELQRVHYLDGHLGQRDRSVDAEK